MISDDSGNIVNSLAHFKLEMVPIALRTFIDFTGYWSQLIFTLALAIERYILIVQGRRATSILNKRRRLFFYGVVMVVVIIPLPLVMVDFFLHVDDGGHELVRIHWYKSPKNSNTPKSYIQLKSFQHLEFKSVLW